MLQTALHYSHILLQEIVTTGDHVVDATMGNGNDTAFLAQLVSPSGHVYAFDIQEQALLKTKERLIQENLFAQTTLFCQGHETLAEVIPKEQTIKAAVFNLGYLPGSGKEIITLPETTKTALEALLERLEPKGRIIVVVYYGHDGGQREWAMLQEFCQALPQASYNVLSYQFINQKNQPPVLYCIEKKRKKE